MSHGGTVSDSVLIGAFLFLENVNDRLFDYPRFGSACSALSTSGI